MGFLQTTPTNRHIPWLTIILVALALIALVAGSDRNGGGVVPMMLRESFGMGGGSEQAAGRLTPSGAPSVGMMEDGVSSMIAPDYYYDGDVPVTDTREFLKTDYSATVRTRKVQEAERRAETIIRGHEGRIDGSSSSEKYGHIQFVVPMSKFEKFRTEIEGLVGPKFLSVQIGTQNMLPQKQSIEEMQEQVESTLGSLKAQRQKLIADHNYSIGTYERQIERNETAIVELMSESTTDPVRRAEIESQIREYQQQNSVFESRIASEKTAHTGKLASYDNQIKYADTSLSAVKNQDQNLLDSVATVRGSLSFQWISLWDIAHLYLPGLSIPGIIVALAALAYMYERRLYFFKNY